MQWHKQAVNVTTNTWVEVDFILREISTTNIVTWKCQVNDSAKGRYDVILRRYLSTEL